MDNSKKEASAQQMSVLDNELLDILRSVRLGDLAARLGNGDETRGLGVEADWSKILSLGEQQRISFARAIYNKPSVVILDESTSALDLESERHMYSLLRRLGLTFISVGHRPSLLLYHDKKVILKGPGEKVEISPIVVTESMEENLAAPRGTLSDYALSALAAGPSLDILSANSSTSIGSSK